MVQFNRTPANAAYMMHEKGVIFSKGRISHKNWPKRLLLRHDTTSFKGACRFTYLIEAKVALYGPILQRYSPSLLKIALNSLKIRGYDREKWCKVLAAEDIQFKYLKYLLLFKNDCNSIPWGSGNTGLICWNIPGYGFYPVKARFILSLSLYRNDRYLSRYFLALCYVSVVILDPTLIMDFDLLCLDVLMF
jgi:hypothetical protein